MLTVGGLFSGIGGIELGLERAGMRVLWHCEADPYARAVLERHWPGVPCYEDVRELRGADVALVDVLCGGFPCQDISVAGRGAGIDGERSGLWSEMFRLVDELRPRYLLVENVAALVSRGLDRVLADLASIGFDAEWDCLRASDVGLCHGRNRIWLVAYPGGEGRREITRGAPGDEAAHEGRAAQDDHEPRGAGASRLPAAAAQDADSLAMGARRERRGASQAAREAPADAAHERHERPGAPWDGRTGPADGDSRDFDWREYEPAIRRHEAILGAPAPLPFLRGVDARLPKRMDRLRCLGNSVVPQIPLWIGTRILEWEGGMT